jgi:hypothetical protein
VWRSGAQGVLGSRGRVQGLGLLPERQPRSLLVERRREELVILLRLGRVVYVVLLVEFVLVLVLRVLVLRFVVRLIGWLDVRFVRRERRAEGCRVGLEHTATTTSAFRPQAACRPQPGLTGPPG